MRNLRIFLLLGAMFALSSLVVLPLVAQDQGGQGGVIVEGGFGNDPATFNPLLTQTTDAQLVAGLMFPTFVGIDPKTAAFTSGAPGAIAKDWKVSDDGKIYTFTLRDDWKWSDGTPITSADVKYGYDAIVSGKTSSPLTYATDPVDKLETPDDHTVVVTFKTAACNNINNIAALPVIPSATLDKLTGGDFSKLDKLDWNLAPTVTAGTFKFGEFVPSDHTGLQADQSYPDAVNGSVTPSGWVWKIYGDETALDQAFDTGEVTLNAPSLQNHATYRTKIQSGELQGIEYSSNGYDWLAWNLADPKNPQNGLDENGKPIDQGHHPLFGDPRVRTALAMAVNVDDVIKGAAYGEGTRVSTASIPTSWAYNPDIKAIPYDPDGALKLLAEAGWVDDDNDVSTPLVAKGAMYAPDGTKFEFDLITNTGNVEREAIGTVVQDNLAKIGVKANFKPIDFNTAVEQLTGQTFDAMILGWSLSFPDDPDFSFAFNPKNDVVGSGFDFPSYSNPKVDDLLDQANNLPGCDQKERAKLYQQAQQVLADDQPYMFLFAPTTMYVAQSNLQSFDPLPNQIRWNIDTWSISP